VGRVTRPTLHLYPNRSSRIQILHIFSLTSFRRRSLDFPEIRL
jgi:hypothetical protein